MKAVIFGATGMVGQAVLRECLLDPAIDAVVSLVRRRSASPHPKLHEIEHHDFHDFSAIERELAGADLCFFAIGVGSAGMNEADYKRVTYDIPIAAATTLKKVNPELSFVFVSAAGADRSEEGKVMWARVKGAAENELSRVFAKSYVFRPAVIQPLHGIKSRTTIYRLGYSLMRPVLGSIVRLFPKYATTTDQLGRAMVHVAKHGWPKKILEADEINRVGSS